MEWRPEGWNEARFRLLTRHNLKRTTDETLVEATATALLEALKAGGLGMTGQSDGEFLADLTVWLIRSKPAMQHPGHLIFIPEAQE